MGDPDAALVHALRAGDDEAFALLVRRYHTRLLRFAESLVPTRAVAEEVVQETWLGVVRGIHGFEGRSSVKTWLFRILVNRARSAGAHEPRELSLDSDALLGDRFGPAGTWIRPPEPWADTVDSRITADGLARRVRECLPQLPGDQREVFTLRDIEGVDAEDACQLLGISAGYQRVLLHRARSRVRTILAGEMGGD